MNIRNQSNLLSFFNKRLSARAGIAIIMVAFSICAGILVWQAELLKQEMRALEMVPESKEKTKIYLTIDALENAKYYVVAYGETVLLKDGYYREEHPGMASGLEVAIYKNKIVFGDLNNDGKKDAAVILRSSGGGSGDFRELAIMINEDGKPNYFISKELGDRVIIDSITIQSGIIVLDMIVHGPSDGLCCPTLKKIGRYKLSKDQLLEMTEDETMNWKTYINEEYEFEIKYPSKYEISKMTATDVAPAIKADSYAQIIFRDLTGFFTKEEIDQKKINSEKIIVGGIEAFRSSLGGNMDSGIEFFVSFYDYPKKGMIFNILFSTHQPEREEEINTFNQMLSTFKFIEKIPEILKSPLIGAPEEIEKAKLEFCREVCKAWLGKMVEDSKCELQTGEVYSCEELIEKLR
ncbi:hypothetical protein KAS79_01555 [Candidatus Parcubacteria bacterium]|nr:hypothetical protein [Candidatus Parcubacteria bacterium]